jgi:hypothetical protein
VCRRLFDIERAEFSSFSPPGELPHGLLVTDWRVEYEVICSACQEEAPNSKGQAKASPGLKKQPGLRPREVPPETS